jgi:dephospho-CoA kinase
MNDTDKLGQRRIIGLTGMYCAGKNHAAGMLEARGIPVLDVDKLGHRAIELEREAILARFGPSVLAAETADTNTALASSIDRKKLGALVFGKPTELAALEGIVHPAANRLTDEWIAAQDTPVCVINAALLHRSSAFARLDAIILVKAPLLTRLLRARRRDKLPWGEIIKRFRSQRKFITQYLQKTTDIYIVCNNGISPFGSRLFRRALERRIDMIISRIGMT